MCEGEEKGEGKEEQEDEKKLKKEKKEEVVDAVYTAHGERCHLWRLRTEKKKAVEDDLHNTTQSADSTHWYRSSSMTRSTARGVSALTLLRVTLQLYMSSSTADTVHPAR